MNLKNRLPSTLQGFRKPDKHKQNKKPHLLGKQGFYYQSDFRLTNQNL